MRRDAQLPPLNFADVIAAFLECPKYRALERNTQIGYESIFKVARLALGDIPSTELTPRTIQKFLDAYSDRPATMQRAKAAIKSLEEWAVMRDDIYGRPYLLTSITIGTRALKGDGAREPWTAEQIELAVQHAPPQLARVVQLAAWTGQRISDLVQMQWRHITEDEGVRWIEVTQRKTGLQLYVPIMPELEAILQTWDRSMGYLLTRPRGGPWRPLDLSRTWYKERESNPLLEPLRPKGLSFHGLRATFVGRLRKIGYTELEIAATVGMSTKMVTRYSRREQQRDLAMRALKRAGTGAEQNNVVKFKKSEIPQ